jgi:hypothetical protein
MRVLRAVSLFGLAGCGSLLQIQPGKYAAYPENPYPELRTIAVLPVRQLAEAPHPVDTARFATIFATELAKFPGVRVVRPGELMEGVATSGGPMTVEDAVLLAERAGADAVVAMTVSDYDPYAPPKMAVQVEVVTARSARSPATSFNIDALVRSGQWGELPVRMDSSRAGHFAAVFELVRDGGFKPTRQAARQFAAASHPDDVPFSNPDDSTIYRSDRFWEFVCNEIVRDFFDRAPTHVQPNQSAAR